MTKKLCNDEMPLKLRVIEGKVVKERVDREEYLQAILYYLGELQLVEGKPIPIPEMIPSNFESGILFLRFLERQPFTIELKSANQ